MDFAKLKNTFLKIMIGCLIATGMIAVVTVLTGSFNDVFGKALITIALIAAHALVSFGYIDISEKNKTANDLSFFHNTTFILIILSFITSIFGVWGILSVGLVGKLYGTYFVLLFAVLHGEILSKMTHNDKTIDNVVFSNYAFMSVVILLIMPVIYLSDAASLGDVYYRILAAFGIIDAILTLLAIILHKLYLQKHPKVESSVFGNATFALNAATSSGEPTKQPKKSMNILVVILLGFLGMQLIGGLVFAVIGRQAASNIHKLESIDPATSNVTTQPNTYSPTPAYSYEHSFTYNKHDYTCSQKISGSWIKSSSQSLNESQQSPTFSFIPSSQNELNNYCIPR